MKFVKPDVILIEEKNPLIKIEKVGRLCYKSESEYTKESATKFVQTLIEKKHTAMLEHANFVFEVKAKHLEVYYDYLLSFKYLNVNYNQEQERILVSGNVRAINESGINFLLNELKINNYHDLVYVDYCLDLEADPIEIKLINNLNELEGLTEEEKKTHSYMSLHFICDRGISHELVRHRVSSFAQESTRYCNYSKDKFGNELTCILPFWFKEDENPEAYSNFICAMNDAEYHYFELINLGYVAQEVRGVLPTSLKTEIVLTMNFYNWDKFFNLRYFGTTGKPHPQMLEVATIAYKAYKELE